MNAKIETDPAPEAEVETEPITPDAGVRECRDCQQGFLECLANFHANSLCPKGLNVRCKGCVRRSRKERERIRRKRAGFKVGPKEKGLPSPVAEHGRPESSGKFCNRCYGLSWCVGGICCRVCGLRYAPEPLPTLESFLYQTPFRVLG